MGKRQPLAPLESEGAGSNGWTQAHVVPGRNGRSGVSRSKAPVVAIRALDGSAHSAGSSARSGQTARPRSTTPTAAKVPAFLRRSQLLTSRTPPAPSLEDPLSVPLSSGHLEALEVIEALKSTLQGGSGFSSHHSLLASRATDMPFPAAADASTQVAEGQSSMAEAAVVPTPQARRPRGSTPVRLQPPEF
jgi:hypothetical protein